VLAPSCPVLAPSWPRPGAVLAPSWRRPGASAVRVASSCYGGTMS